MNKAAVIGDTRDRKEVGRSVKAAVIGDTSEQGCSHRRQRDRKEVGPEETRHERQERVRSIRNQWEVPCETGQR